MNYVKISDKYIHFKALVKLEKKRIQLNCKTRYLNQN